MLMSGLIVLAFLLFHLAHFTLQTIFPIYGSLEFPINGQRAHDVYAMMILGFAEPVVSAFYLVSLGLLCLHLTHGFSSMFQSVGLRNEKWRGRLNGAARAFGLLIFLGFAVIPVAVLVSKYTALQWLPVRAIVEQVAQNQETWDPNQPTPIYVDYQQTPLGLSNTDFGPGGDNH
jgi:succinate dehydrogenase / fumarate reductase cytochrome b subunit